MIGLNINPLAYCSDTTNTKKSTHHKVAGPSKSNAADEINALRDELKKQSERIDKLTEQLTTTSTQLKEAQAAASAAQASAERTEAQAQKREQGAVEQNANAISTLQSAVSELKTGTETFSKTYASDSAKLKAAIESPTSLRYKGINLSIGGYIAGDVIYRSHGTGSAEATPFASIPYEHADAYALSEFFQSARQSRFSLLAEGKVKWGTIRGYYEADFLGAGTASNANQSNSFLLRQRMLFAEAETNSHWSFTSGQMWSLITENKKGITSAAANLALPQTVDPNYVAGFIWARQGAFRVAKNFSRGAVAVSVENPQIAYAATIAGNTPYAVLGSAGVSGGFTNAAIGSCSPSTYVVNYINQTSTTSGGQIVNVAVPVYKTANACTNLANTSFNQAPDVHFKAALDPKLGHFEVFGVLRFAHETVYPGETTNSNLYGGQKDILTGATVAPALSTAGAYTHNVQLGGGGASMRIGLFDKKLVLGAKGLVGAGVGRYDDTSLPDATANAAGKLVPLHNLSGMLSAEYLAKPRLLFWSYYGGDYAGRSDYSGSTLAAPTATQNANGVWGGHWAAPTAAPVGYGSRLMVNTACLTNANPGYNGGSTGFYAGGSCGAQTRDVQEIAGGYWYDVYNGDRGRLRHGTQYGYLVRQGWSGLNGIGAKGIENMIFTTFRYYLP